MMEKVAYCRTRLGTTFGYIYFNASKSTYSYYMCGWKYPESACKSLKDIINYVEKEQELSVKLIGRFKRMV